MNTAAFIVAAAGAKAKLGVLGIVGLVAQTVFAARFFYQWIASERRQHSYVPVGFWWISVVGGVMMLAYALGLMLLTEAGINALAIVLGQAGGLVVYVRNLVLIYRKRELANGTVVEPGDALYVHPDGEQTGDAAPHAPASPQAPDDGAATD
jgi:lipid-A-disaccharide synthase-like uncharacterized protein